MTNYFFFKPQAYLSKSINLSQDFRVNQHLRSHQPYYLVCEILGRKFYELKESFEYLKLLLSNHFNLIFIVDSFSFKRNGVIILKTKQL